MFGLAFLVFLDVNLYIEISIYVRLIFLKVPIFSAPNDPLSIPTRFCKSEVIIFGFFVACSCFVLFFSLHFWRTKNNNKMTKLRET